VRPDFLQATLAISVMRASLLNTDLCALTVVPYTLLHPVRCYASNPSFVTCCLHTARYELLVRSLTASPLITIATVNLHIQLLLHHLLPMYITHATTCHAYSCMLQRIHTTATVMLSPTPAVAAVRSVASHSEA
jgi:hypothetical protein